MILLIDHNLEGHALILLGNIANQGCLSYYLFALLLSKRWSGR